MSNNGLDQFARKLHDLSNKARQLDGTHSVALTEVLTPVFIARHTRFADVSALFEAGGFDAGSRETFEAIPEIELDKFIRSESSFDGWQAMLSAAAAEWTRNRLGL